MNGCYYISWGFYHLYLYYKLNGISTESLSVGDMLKTVYIDRTSYIDRFVYMLTIGNSQTQMVLSCFI